jgi:uncharacterized membrane protein YdbT with pleckstrin-like domain
MNQNIKLGEVNQMPPSVYYYVIIKNLLVLIPIVIIASSLKLSLISFLFTAGFVFKIIYYLFFIKFVNFIVTEDKIILNYGILIKHSSSVSLSSIQNIKKFRGLLMQMMDLSYIKIWTASPNQLRMRNESNSPDIDIIFGKQDIEWIENFILSKTKNA